MKKYRTFHVTNRSIAARELAIQLMGQHGLFDWKFAFNGRKRTAGLCRYPHLGRPGLIELSVHYCEANEMVDIHNTILHEIAHALAGPRAGHGPTWKKICLQIGARPERCYGSHIDMPKGQWQAVCAKCGKTYSRHRRPKNINGWWCRSCGRVYGALVWENF